MQTVFCHSVRGSIQISILGVATLLIAACGSTSENSSSIGTGSSAAEVSVIRDTYNQPSIRVVKAPAGTADEVLSEAQGYEEAREGFRFVQMDMLRRRSTGRMAEVFGPPVIEQRSKPPQDPSGRVMSPAEVSDREVLSTGLPLSVSRSAEKIRQHYPADWKLLEAFARGVNRAISEMETTNPEILRTYRKYTYNPSYVPAPWKPEDSVAIGVATGFHLSSTLTEKVGLGILAILYGLQTTKGNKEFFESFDLRPIENTFIEGKAKFGIDPAFRYRPPMKRNSRQDLWRMLLPKFGGFGFLDCTEGEDRFPMPSCARKSPFGSNNWVVSSSYTETGETLLFNDPHLALTFPTTFYEVALDSKSAGGSLYVRGVNLPGIPGVLIGHNEDIAWGLTNLGADVDDVYLETLDSPTGNKTQIGEDASGEAIYEEMKSQDSLLGVRQTDGSVLEVPFKLRLVRGKRPLVGDHHPSLGEFQKYLQEKGFGVAIAYQWTGHEGSTEFAQLMGVNRARDFSEFQTALNQFDVGAQNFVYADRDGNIGYYAHGKFPIRPYISDDLPPYLPVYGDGRAEWSGFRTRVPQLYNPEAGRIVTANNDPFGHSEKPKLSGLQDYFGAGFSTGIRAKRISDLLVEKKTDGKFTIEDGQSIQTDHHDLLAENFIKLLRGVRDELTLSSEAGALADELLNWNLQAVRQEKAPVKFYVWLEAVSAKFMEIFVGLPEIIPNESVKKNLEELIRQITRATPGMKTAFHRLRDGLATAESFENTKKILIESLEDAAKRVKNQGLSDMRWGQVHRIQFKNIFEGILPASLAAPLERDGAWDTVDVAAGANNAPGFRLSLSLVPGKPIDGFTVSPGGNNSPLAREALFRELLMWRDGKVRPLVKFQ